jgi:hypothetical protein
LRGVGPDRLGNHLKHPVHVVVNILVREPHEADAERFDELLPSRILRLRLLREMAVAIEFDRQLDLRAIEVDAVRADAVLAAKPPAEQLLSAQAGSQQDLGRRHVLAQAAPHVLF